MDLPANDLDLDAYRVHPGCAAGLTARSTRADVHQMSEQRYLAQLSDHIARLSVLQERFRAAGRHALLMIVQGMDAAGKDGTIDHVMSGINPQGCNVFSFKQPSAEELLHDFLWRSNKDLPERGKIGIFNRSYYEEVLIVRVHPEILLNEGFLAAREINAEFWRRRYRSINAMEQHLQENGTRFVKIFLHLSQEEQIKRFLDRIDNPDKNWKLSVTDVAESTFWNAYSIAYENCLTATNTPEAPWFIVPADEKESSRLIVSQILLNVMESLDIPPQSASPERRTELAGIRARLVIAQAGLHQNAATKQ